ncbi:MAG: hypothetical protein H0X65_16400 [Gemmatimonadetes bacterium]|nr:hypothetical protein [Gemmatimonadota bacterium]
MIRRLLLVLGIGIGFAMISAPEVQAGCATCTSQQECAPGSSGSHCIIFYEPVEPGGNDEQWCNWDGECEEGEITMVDPTGLSAAGTFLAGSSIPAAEGGRMVDPCRGFIVARSTPTGQGPVSLLFTLRV